MSDGPIVGDAFGKLLLDCLAAGGNEASAVEIVERSDGLITTGRASRYFAPASEWNPLEIQACEAAHGRILDVGAGAGRHSLFLQERGHRPVALDVSAGAIDVCRMRGVHETFRGTIDDLAGSDAAPFETFLLLGNNLGLLENRDHAPRFLRALANLAAPDAVLIGTMGDPYTTNDPLHLALHARNHAAGRLGGQTTIRIRHRDLASPWFDYLLLSSDELGEIVAGSPWQLATVDSDGSGFAATLRLR